MKTRKLSNSLIVVGMLFITSCNEVLYTTIDVLRPADISFSRNANNLLIVNNSTIQPANIGHKSELINQKTKYVQINTDSVGIYCISALGEDIENKHFFNSVKLATSTVNQSGNYNERSPLSTQVVNTLCKQYGADAILSLDKIVLNDDLTEHYLRDDDSFLGTLEVRYETSWSLHYPNQSNVKNISYRDTLYWEHEAYIRRKAIEGLPKRNDAIVDGALNTGKKSVTRFLPYWDKTDRYFFSTRNKWIKSGIDSVYYRNWNAAIKCWEKALVGSNSHTKSYAANNMAAAYEIMGNIDKAEELSNQSLQLYTQSGSVDLDYLQIITTYNTEIKRRRLEFNLLHEQLGE